MLLMCGLALIAIGGGGIKPCVSAHVGDQFGALNQSLLSKVYGWFYFSINFGSTFSTLLTPVLLDRLGPGWAFGVPGILMALATLVFWMGRNKFVHVPPAGARFFQETFSRKTLKVILNLAPLYLCVAMFWALFDQTAAAWVLQAERMDRVVFDFYVAGRQFRWEVLSSQLQAANPILVMAFIPICSYGLYPWLGRFFDVTPLRKVAIGFFLTVLAFAIPAWVEQRITAGEAPHIMWQILAYVVLTLAEVMVSITALEFSYTQAPKTMKSFIMSVYMLSVSLGNLFTAAVNWFIENPDGTSKLAGASYYWFFTGSMLFVACAFLVFMPFYRGQTYIQGEK
jgi:POT family proton-dependent oligopeptide transporter